MHKKNFVKTVLLIGISLLPKLAFSGISARISEKMEAVTPPRAYSNSTPIKRAGPDTDSLSIYLNKTDLRQVTQTPIKEEALCLEAFKEKTKYHSPQDQNIASWKGPYDSLYECLDVSSCEEFQDSVYQYCITTNIGDSGEAYKSLYGIETYCEFFSERALVICLD